MSAGRTHVLRVNSPVNLRSRGATTEEASSLIPSGVVVSRRIGTWREEANLRRFFSFFSFSGRCASSSWLLTLRSSRNVHCASHFAPGLLIHATPPWAFYIATPPYRGRGRDHLDMIAGIVPILTFYEWNEQHFSARNDDYKAISLILTWVIRESVKEEKYIERIIRNTIHCIRPRIWREIEDTKIYSIVKNV